MLNKFNDMTRTFNFTKNATSSEFRTEMVFANKNSHVYTGYTIPANYDSMIAKLIVRAPSREEALIRCRRALEEFTVEGIKTTIPFHLKLMDDEKFKSGDFDTSFMETFEY